MYNKTFKTINGIKPLLFMAVQLIVYRAITSFVALADEPPPELTDILSIAGRIVNIAVGVAGIVLVIMIAYGVSKSSMATGDPKGLEGAKQTWSYALYGFFIVVGFFSAFLIITGALGISLSPGALLSNVSAAVGCLTNPLGPSCQ